METHPSLRSLVSILSSVVENVLIVCLFPQYSAALQTGIPVSLRLFSASSHALALILMDLGLTVSDSRHLLSPFLAIDTQQSVRKRFETRGIDLLAAVDAEAVDSLFHSAQGRLDLLKLLSRLREDG